MIECSLIAQKEFGSLFETENKKIKYGKYSGSHFYSIPGFGSKCWVIIANIDVDYDKYIAQGMTPENIVESCIEFLNAPPKSRYGKKRRRKPLYGKFRDMPYKFTLKEIDGLKYIQAFLIVEDKRRKHFWGEGEVLNYKRRRR